jgi:hypothetical protein
MGSIEEGWQEFQHQTLPPYINVIRGGHVTWLDAERCEMMFVASDLLFTCSRNFVWNTTKVKMGMLDQDQLHKTQLDKTQLDKTPLDKFLLVKIRLFKFT